jgi:hypothetical protein
MRAFRKQKRPTGGRFAEKSGWRASVLARMESQPVNAKAGTSLRRHKKELLCSSFFMPIKGLEPQGTV